MLLVSAPPGYGKTTYMSLLFGKLGEQGHICAWLTLDEFDQSPEVLTTYVILSLTQAGVDLGHLEQIALEGFVSMPMDVAWSMIIHQLEQHSSPVVLFLDDYHRIENKSINDLTSFFVRRMPATCHIVIGSRSHPNLGLTDFFSRGYLQIIDQQALKFDDSEMAHFFEASALPNDILEHVKDSTEGWPVAAQLVKIWLSKTDSQLRISDFSGRVKDVASYLAEEILADLPPDQQIFMMRTAFLERVNGHVANALYKTTEGWSLLESFERRNLLLQSIDPERQWFRYHHLFAEFLRDRYRRLYPEDVTPLYKAAAAWFGEQGLFREALDLAAKSGDPLFAASLIEDASGWRLAWARGVPLLKTLCTVETPDVRRYPRLGLAHIYLKAKEGQIAAARRQLDQMTKQTAGFTDFAPDVADVVDMPVEGSIIEYFLRFYEDQIQAPEQLQRHMDDISRRPDINPILPKLLQVMLSIAHSIHGNYQEAIDLGLECRKILRQANLHYAEMYISIYLSVSYVGLGRLQDALTFHESTKTHAQHILGEKSNIYSNCLIFLSEIHYLMGDNETALALLVPSLDTAKYSEGYFEVLASGYMTSISLARDSMNQDRVFTLINDAKETARRRGLDRLHKLMELRELKENLFFKKTNAGRHIQASSLIHAQLAHDGNAIGKDLCLWYEAHCLYMRHLLATGNPKQATQALIPVYAHATTMGHKAWGLEITLLMALARHALGDIATAQQHMHQAIAIALPENFRRPFLDKGKEAHETFAYLIRTDPSWNEKELGQALAFITSYGTAKPETTSLRGGLVLSGEQAITPRELEVLVGLADGLSNKEIARKLSVTEGTVKFHRKNLYRKLDVGSRSHLIELARGLGLFKGVDVKKLQPLA